MGSGARSMPMEEWRGENYGIDGPGQSRQPGQRGVRNDAVAVRVSSPVSVAAFVARWCIPRDPLLQSTLSRAATTCRCQLTG